MCTIKGASTQLRQVDQVIQTEFIPIHNWRNNSQQRREKVTLTPS